MSTPAEAFAGRWPLETVEIDFDDVVLQDQLVVEFEKIATPGKDTLTGRVVEQWWGGLEAIVFEDSAGERWRIDENGTLIREQDKVSFGESASIKAVREVVPDGGRAIRKLLPCDGDCQRQTEHVHLRPNSVGRDVWRCTVCEGKRAGPILTKSDVQEQVAADGGER